MSDFHPIASKIADIVSDFRLEGRDAAPPRDRSNGAAISLIAETFILALFLFESSRDVVPYGAIDARCGGKRCRRMAGCMIPKRGSLARKLPKL
jgi:hypothetical protein